jgi:23S rRNA (adenine2503-C2)-methyltransferase
VTPSFLHALTLDELTTWLKTQNEPPFRAKQIFEWLWKHGVSDVGLMTNLSLRLRDAIKKSFVIQPLECINKEASADGETTKYLWKLYDGRMVESVLICAPGRRTVCVSSQVGCPVRCAFCASGKAGFVRNLFAPEIVCQVLAIQQELSKSDERITNVVYMGMGEPLRNYEAVVQSIHFLSDPSYFGFSKRRITVSTVGVVEGILRLAKEGVGVNLALSLHAPTQEIRQKIIPYARQYALEEILKAVDYYHETTGRDITYEYILLEGINDRIDDAKALGLLLNSRQGAVNLIPYNPIPGLTLRRSPTKNITAFREYLDRMGIVNTCRYTKGTDIAAACGQLALRSASESSSAEESSAPALRSEQG